LVAGAIGIFPDLPWARAILPEQYPYFYTSPAGAEALLLRAVTETEACRQELDQSVGGSFRDWLSQHHDDDVFESAITDHVAGWFDPPEEVDAYASMADSIDAIRPE
jgi:hypothetical protein